MISKIHRYKHAAAVAVPVLLLAAVLFSASGCTGGADGDVEQTPVVNVLTVTAGDAENTLTFTGDIRAQRDIRLLSQVAERIVELRADKGDRVRENQILARIENSILERSVDQAEAALESARANANNLESEYRRADRLFREEAISSQQYESIRTQFENSRAALRQAEAALAQAQRQYENSYIRAPFSGFVSSRYLELGDMVSPGTPVFSLIQTDTMRAFARVSEREFSRIAEGQPARLSVSSYPDVQFEGRVVRKTPILDQLSRLAQVEVHFPNADNRLISGMFGELDIVVGQKTAVPLIPLPAVQYRTVIGDRAARIDEQLTRVPYVFLVKDGRAVRRDITTGYRSRGLIEAASGITPGDTLIVQGQNGLNDGDPVEIVEFITWSE